MTKRFFLIFHLMSVYMFSEALCVCITMRGSIHDLLFPLREKLYVLCNLVKEYVHILVWAVVQTKKEHIWYIKSQVIFCTIVTNNSCSVFSICEPLLFFFVTRYQKVNLFEMWSNFSLYTVTSRHICNRQLPLCHTLFLASANMLSEDPQLSLGLEKRCFLPVQHMEEVFHTEAKMLFKPNLELKSMKHSLFLIIIRTTLKKQ